MRNRRKMLLLLAKKKSGGGSIWKQIIGSPPLTLLDAKNSIFGKIKQYGKCTQASTPTPSSPVDILCNNGVLKMVDDELPSGYKRLLGLTFNNNAYYAITGFKMRGSDTLRFSFKCSMQNPACNVLGAYDGASAQSNYSLYIGNSSSAKYLRYNGGTYRSDADSGTQYDVVVTPTGSTGMKSDSTWTEKTFESTGDLCVGTTSPTATSSKMVGDIVGNIVVDGRLKLIPCERVSGNVLGYYDTVGETFYEPTGSGVVSMGYDGSHYELFVVGTPEVLTVSASGVETQTASVADLFAVGDYKDEQDIISGLRTHKVGIKVFDGTENWELHASASGTYRLDGVFTDLAQGVPILSSLLCTNLSATDTLATADFTPGMARWSGSSVGTVVVTTSGTRLYACFGLSTVQEVKAFLADKLAAGTPVIVLYPLAQETTESVTPQPLTTTEGTNVVEVTSNVDPVELDISYKARRT